MDIQHHDGYGSLWLFIGNVLLYGVLSVIGNVELMDSLTSTMMHIVGTISLAITAYYAIKNGRKKRK